MALDQGADDSVYDFLYIDSRRIALFISQFSQYGHLTSLTRSRTESATASGGLDVKLAKINSGEAESTTLERQFDAQWVAPLTFLDQANQRGMIVKQIASARMGQLVLARGDLEVRDLTIIKRAFALPAMQAHLSSAGTRQRPHQSRAERRREQREKPETSGKEFSPEEFGLQFLAELPHALHATLNDGRSRIWCSLREDALLVSVSDLFLKHGVKISGQWNMLGILDALPDAGRDTTSEDAEAEFQKAQAAMPQGDVATLVTLVTQGFGGFIDGIAPLARIFLGRHSDAFGMTPLLIFREISA